MKKFKEWFINNIISITTLIWPVIATIVAFVANYIKKSFTIFELLLFIIIMIIATIFFVYFLWRSCSYKSYHYSWLKIKPKYEIVRNEVIYKVEKGRIKITDGEGKKRRVADYKLNFSQIKRIKCLLSQGLDRITCKYMWTGKSSVNLPSSTNGNQIREISNKKGSWKFYDIVFDQTILRGKDKEIICTYPVINDCKSSSPFVSTTTDEPTRELIFKIDLGEEYKFKNMVLEEVRSNESNYVLESKNLNLDENGKLEYIIRKPKRFRTYVIHWSW